MPGQTLGFDVGTTVTLTALPSATSTFTGWSGGCSGTGPCSVTMNAASAVTATFKPVIIVPTVVACTASPNRLFPPDHRMVDISVSVTGFARFILASVTSSEPDDADHSAQASDNEKSGQGDDRDRAKGSAKKDSQKGEKGDKGEIIDGDDDEHGDGHTINDIQGWTLGTPDLLGMLRAERDGSKAGRVDTLTYRGTNAAGAAAATSCTVVVPRNQ